MRVLGGEEIRKTEGPVLSIIDIRNHREEKRKT
jgi:hypothetical protein